MESLAITERKLSLDVNNLVPYCTIEDENGVRFYFGERGLDLFQRLRGEGDILRYQQEARDLNGHFYHAMADVHNVSEDRAQAVYGQSIDRANAFINGIVRDYLMEQKDLYGLRTEIQADLTPFDRIAVLAGILGGEYSDRVDNRLRFQVKRQILLADAFTQLMLRRQNGPYSQQHSSLIATLGCHLFTPRQGRMTEQHEIRSFHDNVLNTFIGTDIPEKERIGVHEKTSQIEARLVEGLGYVIFNSRRKDDDTAVLKALRKATRNGGVVNPCQDVQDAFGIKIVLLEFGRHVRDDVQNTLVRRVSDIVLKCEPDISGIELDDEVGVDANQHKGMFFNRLQVSFQKLEMPIEIMFQSGEDYLNSELEVGRFDAMRGMYTGRAHRLYEINRLLDETGGLGLLSKLYTPEIYNQEEILRLIRKQMHRLARQLREERREDDIMADIDFCIRM